jgi:hypothetical protein
MRVKFYIWYLFCLLCYVTLFRGTGNLSSNREQSMNYEFNIKFPTLGGFLPRQIKYPKLLCKTIMYTVACCQLLWIHNVLVSQTLFLSIQTYYLLPHSINAPDREKVRCKQSWPIHQVCSCAQCAMQKKMVYCGALPCLAHVESCGAETCPPPPKALISPFARPLGIQSTCSFQEGWTWIVHIYWIREQPNLGSAATGECT